MRKWFPAIALLCVALAGWLYWQGRPGPDLGASYDNAAPSPATQPQSPATTSAQKLNSPGQPASASNAIVAPSGNPPAITSSTATAALPVPARSPHEPEFTNFPPEIVLDKVAHAIRDYASMFGGNPVGTNPEITAALNGNNPRQARFINSEAGMRINGKGELVDAWGTPYFFHQLSGTDMEIHSAGPDLIMWTADDLITK